MKSKLCTVLLVSAVLLAAADSALAYRRGYGRGGGYGSGLGGFSPGGIINSMGQYNLNTSRALINYQQAYAAYLDNRKKFEATYFDMRRMHASYRAEQALPQCACSHPAPTEEQLVAFSKSRMPAPLSPNDFDPAHGVLKWPSVLRNKDFDNERHQIESLFSQVAGDPQASGLGTENYREIQHAIGNLDDKLHSKIDHYSADEYIPASKFLKSLAYQARTPIEVAGTAK